jgi:hypothetical protein
LPQVRQRFLLDMRWPTLKRPAAVKQPSLRQSRHVLQRQNLKEVLDSLNVSQGREPSQHSADDQERSLFYKLRLLKKCPAMAVEYERELAAHQRSESMPAGSQAVVTPVKRSHWDCDSFAGSGTRQRLRKSEDDDTPAQSHRLSEVEDESQTIFGHILAFRGEIEAQGRGSLHPHTFVWEDTFHPAAQ